MYSPTTMYLVEVLALVYISHLRQCKRVVQFATCRSRAFGQRWACVVCVSCSQYLLLPLAIVSEYADKLTAYLCRAVEGPTSGIGAVQAPSLD